MPSHPRPLQIRAGNLMPAPSQIQRSPVLSGHLRRNLTARMMALRQPQDQQSANETELHQKTRYLPPSCTRFQLLRLIQKPVRDASCASGADHGIAHEFSLIPSATPESRESGHFSTTCILRLRDIKKRALSITVTKQRC